MKATAVTDIGKTRAVNQDYVYASLEEVGCLPNLFIVADGMGGHKAGDLASRVCIEEGVNQIRTSTARTPVSAFEQAIAAANQRV